jgi:hypothetical protein
MLIRRLILLASATLAFTACTMSFTYNRLDWLIPWYVDGYVDLTRQQRKTLRQQLAPHLQWHRREELTGYIELLDRIESDLRGPVSEQTVQGWIDEVLAAAQRVEETALTVALTFGAEVSDAQMEEFTASLWEKQREYEEEFLSRSDRQYARDNFAHLEDLLDRFLGRLSAEQEATLREAADSLERFDHLWLEERAAWLNLLTPLLQRPEGWQAAIENAYQSREDRRTTEYRRVQDHNTAVVTHAIAEALPLMDSDQRNHAAAEIEDLRRMLRKLVERPERDQTAGAESSFRFKRVGSSLA